MMRSQLIRVSAFLCLASLQAALAQTTTGSISGTVQDASGGTIPNASVIVTEQTRNITNKATTDSSGRYVFPTLSPGLYDLKVEVPGFKTSETKNLTLQANQNLAAPEITLQVGQVIDTVEVQAQGTQLQTESGERSASLVNKQINNIALNSRSYLPLVALVPGITTAPTLQTAGHGGIGSINANGGRSNQNNLTLDGVGNVDTGNNGDQLATVSLDSVQEFRILTSNYQAEYGRSSGSQISVVTRSGTNQFHGSAYLYHRNEGLNANNWIANRDGLPRQKFRFNDAGWTLGGPIFIPKVGEKLKNRVFFFASQEYQNQLQPHGISTQTVPTALERQGDFSQSVDKSNVPFPYIKDPLSNQPCATTAGGNHAGCFQDGGVLGRIPQSRLYGPGVNILNAFPLPNTSSTGYNFQSQVSASYPRREDLGRIDLVLNEKNKVFARFIYNKDSVTSPYGSFVLGSNIPKAEITDARPGRAWATNWTSNINPTTVNEFTWGFGKNVINISPTSGVLSRTYNNLTGLPVLYPNAITNDFIPSFNFQGTRIANATGNFGTSNAPFFNFNSTIELIDNLSKVINNHTVKIGFFAQRSRKNQNSFAANNGNYDFGDDPNNPFDTNFGFANAAVGVYRNFNQASSRVSGAYRYTNIEWYAQDTWKATRRLTLDYGLRFYWIQPQYEELQQTSNFLPNLYNPAAAPRLYFPAFNSSGTRVAKDLVTGNTLPAYAIGNLVTGTGNLTNGIVLPGRGISKYLTKNRGISYSPRFGFAYDVTGQQRFVIRGGAGMFYDRYQGNEIFNLITNPPTAFAPSLNYGFVATGIDPKSALLGPSGLTTIDPSGKNPVTANYSFGVQTKLPFSLVLDTSYVGSRSWHLISRRNYNAIPYGATFLPQNQDPTSTAKTPGSAAYPVNLIRPYQGYADITDQEFVSTSNFNSLQVSVNRQFAGGLFLGLAYTYSKALGVTSGDGDYTRIDNLTRFANYGPLNFDIRHVLAVNYIYNLPSFFRGRAFLHSALDGWQLSGLTRFRSGNPFEVGYSVAGFGNPQITGSYTEGGRVQIAGDPYANSGGIYNYLNPGAFAPPTPNNIGSIGLGEGRNPFRGPHYNNTDISIQKEFALGERFSLQLRGDAFNIANHPNFQGNPGGACNNSGINCTVNFAGLSGGVTNLYINPNGTINKTGFGTIAGATDPRILQLAARFVF